MDNRTKASQGAMPGQGPKPDHNESTVNSKGGNPNRFPEESMHDQRDLPYEGEDFRAPLDDDTKNQEQDDLPGQRPLGKVNSSGSRR